MSNKKPYHATDTKAYSGTLEMVNFIFRCGRHGTMDFKTMAQVEVATEDPVTRITHEAGAGTTALSVLGVVSKALSNE